MKQSPRSERVAELIREEIAKMITRGLKDPRIGFVSVMGVKMSPDLHYADVYVSLYGSEKEKKSSIIALRNSEGFVRRELGKFLRMRSTPEVRFMEDDSLNQVYHLEEVIREIHQQDESAPMLKLSLAETIEELTKANSFLLTSHVNPDGDSVGSVLAFSGLLKALGKKNIHMVMSDPVPRIYQNLPGAGSIKQYSPDDEAPRYDLAVLLDCNRRDRIGDVDHWIPAGKRVLIVDHHLGDDPEGDVGFIDTSYAAVGEIVVELFQAAGLVMDQKTSHCAYVAQVTDTGGYRYANTTARSLRLGAQLMDAGINTAKICSEVFDVLTPIKFTMLKLALDRMAFVAGGKAAYTYISREDMDSSGAKREDLEGLVNYARKIDGAEAGVFFTGATPTQTKVSMRSSEALNAANFLSEWGGGGHAAAAGASIDRPLAEVMPEVIARLEAVLEGRA
jgi:phosphoesterase RecJ-like protein